MKKDVIQKLSNDDVEELKLVFKSLYADIDKVLKINLSPLILDRLSERSENVKLPLIDLSAFYGLACFRFLYINSANLINESRSKNNMRRIHRGNRAIGQELTIMQLAIVGGNVDIIQIIEQAGIHPGQSCIQYAIRFHLCEIFDWLADKFPEHDDFSTECFRKEFIH